MSTEKQKEIWLAAYCAAITGVLANAGSEGALRTTCVRAANAAVEEFEKRWQAGEAKTLPVRGL